MKYIIRYLTPLCLILMWSVLAAAQAAAGFPLVIVVHGIGGGNADDGWSRKYASDWSAETHEVTFRYEGRTDAKSMVDFGSKAGDWALDAQRQIKDIIRQNPGRRVVIVSHSWGTVISKLALAGGVASGQVIDGIKLDGVEIEELVTLASPLGNALLQSVAGVQTNDLPALVKQWTNFFDIADPISKASQHLAGAENLPVQGSGNPFDITGISAHKGIWTNRLVSKHIWDLAVRVSEMPRLPATRVGEVTAPPQERRRTEPGGSSGGSSDEQIVAEYRSLLPAVLEKNRKPWHTRINLVANAEKQGAGYHVNYQTYCLIEQGPDKGKDYMCFEFDTVLDLGKVKAAVAEMRRQLGR